MPGSRQLSDQLNFLKMLTCSPNGDLSVSNFKKIRTRPTNGVEGVLQSVKSALFRYIYIFNKIEVKSDFTYKI
jgi:hypothetical protein